MTRIERIQTYLNGGVPDRIRIYLDAANLLSDWCSK